MSRLLFVISIFLLGCRYADFAPIEPQPLVAWQTNAHIAELTEMAYPFDRSLIVEGVVVANDSTGNFYKQIILVDPAQSASLAVTIGYYDSYAQFAEQELVAVELQGLVLKKVNGLLTAGYPSIAPDTIPAPISTLSLALRHLHCQGQRVVLPAITCRFDELSIEMIGRPFVFTDVYMENLLGVYAGERTIFQTTSSTSATLYTSPYATFASDPVADGVFDMRAVVMSYQGAIQLQLTDKPSFN